MRTHTHGPRQLEDLQFTVLEAVRIVLRDGAVIAVDRHTAETDELEIVLHLADRRCVSIRCPQDDRITGVIDDLRSELTRRLAPPAPVAPPPHRVAGPPLPDDPQWLVLRPLADTTALSQGRLLIVEKPS